MDVEKIVNRGIMRHYWKRDINATEATKFICEAECIDTVNIKMVQRWYRRSNIGDFDLNDKHHSSRLSTVNIDVIRTSIEDNPRQSVRNLSREVNIPQTTVYRGLKFLDKAYKSRTEIPHDLNDNQKRSV